MSIFKTDKTSKSERLENGQILARVIIEMIGKPREHINKTFKTFIEEIKADEEIVVVHEDTAKPKASGEFFTIFSELELWFKDHRKIIHFMLDYMPSSIEILEPDRMIFRAQDFSDFITDLQGRLHQLDLAVKTLKAERELLKKATQDALRNMIFLTISGKGLEADKIAKYTGVGKDQLQPYLDKLLEDGKITKDGNKYLLKKK